MRKLFLLAASLIFVPGCCNIPANLPVLLDKTSERLEIRSAVVLANLQTLIDESEFTKQDLEDVRSSLASIDSTSLSAPDRASLEESMATLHGAIGALTLNPKVKALPTSSSRIFEDIQKSLKLSSQIVGDSVDQKELLNDAIELVSPKGEEK